MTSVLLCPDKFKGSLTAAEASAALQAGLSERRPDVHIESFAISDGGDGLIDAMARQGFTIGHVRAQGPTGLPRMARVATLGPTTVIELAEVVGAGQLPHGRPAPLTASTFGLGQAMLASVEAGSTELIVGLGGSSSTDGGAGMVEALGGRLRGRDGRALPRGGAALIELSSVDLGALDPRLNDITVTVASDVDRPLLGERGAARSFAPQKGASPGEVELLEAAMTTWAETVSGATATNVSARAGAGAAGGTGFGAMAVLGATMRSGIELLLQLSDFSTQVGSADLVIVGEGSLDDQTLDGKAPIGIAHAARAAGADVVAVCGVNRLHESEWRAQGMSAVYSLDALSPDLRHSMKHAGSLLRQVGRTIADRHLHPVTHQPATTERAPL